MAPAELYIQRSGEEADSRIVVDGVDKFENGSLKITVDARNKGSAGIVIDEADYARAHLRDPEGNVLFSVDLKPSEHPIVLLDNLHVLQLQSVSGNIFVRNGVNLSKTIHFVDPGHRDLEKHFPLAGKMS